MRAGGPQTSSVRSTVGRRVRFSVCRRRRRRRRPFSRVSRVVRLLLFFRYFSLVIFFLLPSFPGPPYVRSPVVPVLTVDRGCATVIHRRDNSSRSNSRIGHGGTSDREKYAVADAAVCRRRPVVVGCHNGYVIVDACPSVRSVGFSDGRVSPTRQHPGDAS